MQQFGCIFYFYSISCSVSLQKACALTILRQNGHLGIIPFNQNMQYHVILPADTTI